MQLISWMSALVATAATAVPRTSVDRHPVADPRPLMVQAIDSPAGVAYGRLASGDAAMIAKHFHTQAPINVDVSTLVRYRQPGCSRLSVLFWQDGVVLEPGAAPTRRTVEFGINYCRDGMPPRDVTPAGS